MGEHTTDSRPNGEAINSGSKQETEDKRAKKQVKQYKIEIRLDQKC